jgi:hypothetical protein
MVAARGRRRPPFRPDRLRKAASLRFPTEVRGAGNVAARNAPLPLRRPPGTTNTSKINI